MSCSLLRCALVLPLLVLAGCGAGTVATPTASTPLEIKGAVHGGQQAVTNSRVYVFAASTSGYGSASHSLLRAVDTGLSDATGAYVLSGQDGGFSVSGDYTCTPGQQVYLLALGGNPGNPILSTDNSAIALMATAGTCPAAGTFASTIPFAVVNEVSTVAAAYALAGFTTSPTAVATSTTSLGATGLANAFATSANLSNIATGLAYAKTPAVSGFSTAAGLSSNGTVPQTRIDSLANILAACINTTGPGSTGCTQLFAAATANGASNGTKPGDTATAAINIAHNPFVNLSGIALPDAPFQPALPNDSPGDWTLEIDFTAPKLQQPFFGAADADGNIWLPDINTNAIIKLSPTGTVLSGTTGFMASGGVSPLGIAIDGIGNAYVAESPGVYKFSSTGAVLASVTTGNNQKTNMAIDPSGNPWLDDYTNVIKLGTNLAVIGTYANPLTLAQTQIAISSTGTVWAPQANLNQLVSISNDGSTVSTHTGAGLHGASGVAIDSAGNIWAGNNNGSISAFHSNGTAIGNYTGGGLDNNNGLSIDGLGHIIALSNPGGGSNSTLAIFASDGTPLSPSSGYIGNINFPTGGVIDGSGNVWVSNRVGGYVSEFIGLVTPVATPILPNQLGVRP